MLFKIFTMNRRYSHGLRSIFVMIFIPSQYAFGLVAVPSLCLPNLN